MADEKQYTKENGDVQYTLGALVAASEAHSEMIDGLGKKLDNVLSCVDKSNIGIPVLKESLDKLSIVLTNRLITLERTLQGLEVGFSNHLTHHAAREDADKSRMWAAKVQFVVLILGGLLALVNGYILLKLAGK